MEISVKDVAKEYKQQPLPNRVASLKEAIRTRPRYAHSPDGKRSLWDQYDALISYALADDDELLFLLREAIRELAIKDGLAQQTEYTKGITDLLVNSGDTAFAPFLIQLIEQKATEIEQDLIETLASHLSQHDFDPVITRTLKEWFFSTDLPLPSVATILVGLASDPSIQANWWEYVKQWLHICETDKPNFIGGKPEMMLAPFFLHMDETLYNEGLPHLTDRQQKIVAGIYKSVQKKTETLDN